MFRIHVFGTGSRGNSALVSDGETNILIDAGVWLDVVQNAVMISDINAVLLTHEHGDHTEYVFELTKGYCRPVFATNGTMAKVDVPTAFEHIISCGQPFTIGTLAITPFPLSHDAAEPCGFFIRNSLNETLVWAGDTGTMDGLQMDKPADCYVLEANYDEDTIDQRLERGELPYAGLHGRLTSEYGHLSVQQAAAWLEENARPDSHIVILHSHEETKARADLFAGFEHVIIPDKRGRLVYEFGKKCPF